MAGSKAVQVLEILKKISDESHPVTQAELLEAMRNMDGVAATENPGTLSNTIDGILRQINPVEYTEENEPEYRIKYRGYPHFLHLSENSAPLVQGALPE